MNPVDLGQVAAALQGPTLQPLELPKLEALLSEVLDRLAAVEVASGAYSKAAVHMLLRIDGQRLAAAEEMPVLQAAGAAASAVAGSRVRRVAVGSGGSSRAQQGRHDGFGGVGAAGEDSGAAAADDDVARLKAYMASVEQQQQEQQQQAAEH
jgi:hypothetical protein